MKLTKTAIKNLPVTQDLVWDRERKTHDEVDVKPTVIERDGRVLISAEDATSYLFADYYGEYRGGYPWINPDLEAWATRHGYELEWENPGCLSVHAA